MGHADFLAGMPIGQVVNMAALAPIAGYLAYIFPPHITIRVNKFLVALMIRPISPWKAFLMAGY